MQAKRENRPAGNRKKALGLLLLLVFTLTAWSSGYASSDKEDKASLVDTLYKKGVLTEEEYDQLKKQDNRFDKMLKALGGLNIGTLSYFQYVGGESNKKGFHEFRLTRGYINVKVKLAKWLRFRVTPDAHQDDTGDFKLRLKYLYAEFLPPDLAFLTDMRSEVGIGHMPWLDFEEHINPYRCQGTMFIERAGLFNSADLGVSIRGYFGGQLGAEYQSNVSKYYAGRWGSWHVGVYNGAGYHAIEVDDNVVPEVRVTFRPLPDLIPGLQVHYFGLFGKGNKEYALPVTGDAGYPLFQVNLGMLSYQNAWVTFTGQYALTNGNAKGTFVLDNSVVALQGEGFSFFFNTKLPFCKKKFNLFARYDRFDPDKDNRATNGQGDDAYDLIIGGAAWEFFHHWYLLAAYQQTFYEKNSGGVAKVPSPGLDLADAWQAQLVLQMAF
jgi:hypothetical protein